MDNKDYMLVHKSILPSFFKTVIEAREKIEGEKKSVIEVCKELSISRSTYYKYKDYIFYPETNKFKTRLSFNVNDVSGVLASIISKLSSYNCNVISINQNSPIGNLANITITIDTSNINNDFNMLFVELKALENVKKVEVVAHE